jgi:hypothetical protein
MAGTAMQVLLAGVNVTTNSEGAATGDPSLSRRTVKVGAVNPAVKLADASTMFRFAALVTDVEDIA